MVDRDCLACHEVALMWRDIRDIIAATIATAILIASVVIVAHMAWQLWMGAPS
jgi:hypothetical protein